MATEEEFQRMRTYLSIFVPLMTIFAMAEIIFIALMCQLCENEDEESENESFLSEAKTQKDKVSGSETKNAPITKISTTKLPEAQGPNSSSVQKQVEKLPKNGTNIKKEPVGSGIVAKIKSSPQLASSKSELLTPKPVIASIRGKSKIELSSASVAVSLSDKD